MMKKTASVLFGLGVLAALGMGSAQAGDAAAGEKLFKKQCKACHAIGKKKPTGPNLQGMFDRKAGKADGYRYSKGPNGLAEADFMWDDENLDKWLTNPKKFLKKAKMVKKVKKPAQRADLIAYLREATK